MALSENSCFLLLDVGGTFVKAGAATVGGRLLDWAEFSHPIPSDGSREEIERALVEVVVTGIDRISAQHYELAGIGLAVPGPFDYAAGVPLMIHKFARINGVSLRDLIGRISGVGPSMPIRFIHDVHAVLAGELFHGNAVGCSNAAVITLGTGLGFFFSREGVIRCAPSGGPLITIYNRPFASGILEDYVSKRGFIRTYEEITGTTCRMTVEEIGAMAARGDESACRTFEQVASLLAEAIKPILLDQHTECLLFGGQISKSFAYMERALHERLDDLPDLRRIAQVKNIGEAAFYGLYSVLTV